MKNVKNFRMYESTSSMSHNQRERLSRIEKNKSSFVFQFKIMAKKGKAQEFADHYDIIMYIQEEPNLMASILLPLIKDSKFTEWIGGIKDELPDSFKDSIGIASDLKNLGF